MYNADKFNCEMKLKNELKKSEDARRALKERVWKLGKDLEKMEQLKLLQDAKLYKMAQENKK